MTERIEHALCNLQLSAYRGMRELFGDLLVKRSTQKEPDCFFFNLFAPNQAYNLRKLTEDCDIFIRQLGLHEAQRKCRKEIDPRGLVGRPPREFNARCVDFWAEMAAIRILVDDGFDRFKPVEKNHGSGITSDYRAYRNQAPAYIEVKNLHANATVLDVFSREIVQAYELHPTAYALCLRINYPYDDPPTATQEKLIKGFILQIAGRTPPFDEVLDLGSAITRIHVTHGKGTAFMVRGVGGDCPEAVNYDWLLKKVRNKAEEARVQMPPAGDHTRVLVINVDTTDAMLSLDFVRESQNEIREVLGSDVLPYVLHFRNLVRIESVTEPTG